MRELIEAAGRRVIREKKYGQNGTPVAVGTFANHSAEDTFAILP